MDARLDALAAAAVLKRGGVIAYPTEGVWGLGCDPFDAVAVQRLLALKCRPVEKGLILIAGALSQLDSLVDLAALDPLRRDVVLESWPGAQTWLLPATFEVPKWITGAHASVAVRVSAHPPVRALCAAFGGALVSTSANRADAPAPRKFGEFDPALLAELDGGLAGETGGLGGPTPIRDTCSGERLRD
ncbi:MAG TPA: Sua5/YciO/YrdC/YwlC family protein [Xanthomonadaceae bacterium]|nr:Sua5/YciO/YrdC/YwlC family protein [Xanthomonadaceae bacterium]